MDVAKFWDRRVRPLRPQNRARPTAFDGQTEPAVLQGQDAVRVSEFWRRYYGGEDWWLDVGPTEVRAILEDTTGLALGVSDGDGVLMGTILCRSIVPAGAKLCVGTDVSLPIAYRIEGLCVHPDWRGKHLAGWLIAWVDYQMNREGPNAFFWAREVPAAIHGTNISLHTYSYCRITDLRIARQRYMSVQAIRISWSDICKMWANSATGWRSSDRIVGTRLFSEDAERMEAWTNNESGQVVILADTMRRTREDNEPIWEVQWCGWRTLSGNLLPARQEDDFRRLLETAATADTRKGVLFASDVWMQGGAKQGWPLPWKFGTSGFHAIYIYNYMPPTFWTCELIALRSEV
jgi:GNAT superfamily N-acetyltransferase